MSQYHQGAIQKLHPKFSTFGAACGSFSTVKMFQFLILSLLSEFFQPFSSDIYEYLFVSFVPLIYNSIEMR